MPGIKGGMRYELLYSEKEGSGRSEVPGSPASRSLLKDSSPSRLLSIVSVELQDLKLVTENCTWS